MSAQAPIDPAVPVSETTAPAAAAPQAGYAAPAAPAAAAPNNGYTAHAQAGQPPKDDIAEWIDRVKEVVNKPEIITAPAPQGSRPWKFSFWEFCMPVDTCLVTWCCPCVTFGKTHHRLRKDPQLRDYSPVNPSCIAFCVSAYFCGHICLQMLQRHDIRTRNNLEGECAGDCLRGWCCPWCDLVQQDKEAEYQLLNNSNPVVAEQPSTKQEMQMQPPAA